MRNKRVTLLVISLLALSVGSFLRADLKGRVRSLFNSVVPIKNGTKPGNFSDFNEGDCLMNENKTPDRLQFFYKIISKTDKGFVWKSLMVPRDLSEMKEGDGKWGVPTYYEGPEFGIQSYIKIPCDEVPEKK